jgi:hypothetical protein
MVLVALHGMRVHLATLPLSSIDRSQLLLHTIEVEKLIDENPQALALFFAPSKASTQARG